MRCGGNSSKWRSDMEAQLSGGDDGRPVDVEKSWVLGSSPRMTAVVAPEMKAAPETKAVGEGASALDLKDAFEEFLGAFDQFKQANDERLGEIERKVSADVITEEKVARISDALDG